MNPFLQEPVSLEDTFTGWRELIAPPRRLPALAREKLLLAALMEQDACAYCPEPAWADLKRELSLLRRCELFGQLRLRALLSAQSPIEEAVCAEQLEIDFTAALRALPGTKPLYAALEFSLLEDADHLYRFANLLDMEQETAAECLTGGRVEITPGRPSVTAHRHPLDAVFQPLEFNAAPLTSALAVVLMSGLQRALSQDYAAQSGCQATSEGRALFAEMAVLEEQHATQYASLWDPRRDGLENLMLRQYAECYLYYSLLAGESDGFMKDVWRLMLDQETAHLHFAARLLREHHHAEPDSVIADGEFPPPFVLDGAPGAPRQLLPRQVTLTMLRDSLIPSGQLPGNYAYFDYQQTLNGDGLDTPSHRVIEKYVAQYGTDYRFENSPNPIEALQSRRVDNISLGRTPAIVLRSRG